MERTLGSRCQGEVRSVGRRQ